MHCALMLSSPIITLALSTHVAKPSIGAHQLCTLWRRCKGASVLARGTIIPDFAFANAKVIALALLRARTYLVGFAVARARVLAPAWKEMGVRRRRKKAEEKEEVVTGDGKVCNRQQIAEKKEQSTNRHQT
uniref:Secreted protein n=1 Tax=Palpitomonas bilix TaxID=652834 RepID=A0A7S3DJS7_9EUKA|mmetsp:Transcript_40018/g.103566  ORF Transcript_40018/g.103566 Transcript_40018/m.103566 type:complete len:131 (+) Transcript_40018:221-613(+)